MSREVHKTQSQNPLRLQDYQGGVEWRLVVVHASANITHGSWTRDEPRIRKKYARSLFRLKRPLRVVIETREVGPASTYADSGEPPSNGGSDGTKS